MFWELIQGAGEFALHVHECVKEAKRGHSGPEASSLTLQIFTDSQEHNSSTNCRNIFKD